ncbi:hypothetical protein GCM10010236_29930 [Streptomyces eurythermus]|nr:hypothetical protein GCM10010236_29930 [Streptomyces eurythermus]
MLAARSGYLWGHDRMGVRRLRRPAAGVLGGENEAMAVCKRCGERKRRRPRSCSRCDSGWDRADTTADVADLAVNTGVLGWVGRGIAGVARLVVRALD